MNDTKIFIKGKPGFKPALKAQLGGAWIHGDSNISVDTMMYSISAESELKAFKASIGEKLIAAYELQFLTSVEDQDDSESSNQPVTERPLTMTIWTNPDSGIGVRKTQRLQHDPSPEVVF
jgi:hypothetical protein